MKCLGVKLSGSLCLYDTGDNLLLSISSGFFLPSFSQFHKSLFGIFHISLSFLLNAGYINN
jgi:hypothetical protein